jgi:N-ethylmaleimide reductase
MGRRAHSSFNDGQQIVSASAIAMDVPGVTTRDLHQNSVPYEVPRELTLKEITNVVDDYAQAASYAKQAGFDGVEIHAANGYLLDCFLQSSANHRTDGYGGSKEKRFRIVQEVVESIGRVFPYDRVGLRVSPNGSLGSNDNHSAFTYYAHQLNRYGLAYLHVMDGTGYGFHGLDQRLRLMDVRKVYDNIIMANVGYTKDLAEGVLRSGAADLIAFGRPYLSNPDLVERMRDNLPLNDVPGNEAWFGRKPDPADCLEGYLNYRPFYEAQFKSSR